MNIERIEIEHNKKITALFSFLLFIIIAGICVCVALIGTNFIGLSRDIGKGLTVVIAVLLSLWALIFCILFINQVAKLPRNIIFVADENGIYDYSRRIVLKPIMYSEIKEIAYKDFLSADVEASELRHLKITLKDNRSYMKKLNLIQKISFLLGLKHIELHLFCGKTRLNDIAEKLKMNLEVYNRINGLNRA